MCFLERGGMKLTDRKTGAVSVRLVQTSIYLSIFLSTASAKDLRFYEVVTDVHYFHGTELLLKNLHSFG
jgi:hypothetical protein